MKTRRKQSGITLMEMTVVVAIVALLAVFGLPAIRAFVNSLESKGPAEAMIDAALSSARAIALKEQRYAGIRFQKAYDSKGPLEAAQYMIFIVYDYDKTTLANGFRAVEGIQPIKLPEAVGAIDLMVRTNHGTHWTAAEDTGDRPITVNDLDDTNPANLVDGKNIYITDTTSFSLIFSPSGKLVIHDVRVRNKDGVYQPDNSNPNTAKHSMDDIFNSPVNIRDNKIGMFVQDDYAEFGLGAESSRNNFVIYDKAKFNPMNNIQRYDYLHSLVAVYINPYAGTIINR
jgi:prepilin-type N-terminal cleavage/methylation domain-containing protein